MAAAKASVDMAKARKISEMGFMKTPAGHETTTINCEPGVSAVLSLVSPIRMDVLATAGCREC
ncbi:hypothetical protein D9M73_219030 [compost metagenome]